MAGSKNFFSTSNVVQAGAAGSVAPAGGAGEEISSQMPGSVFKILVQNGAQVSEGQTILGVEAMKIESRVAAPATGRLELQVSEGQQIQAGDVLAVVH